MAGDLEEAAGMALKENRHHGGLGFRDQAGREIAPVRVHRTAERPGGGRDGAARKDADGPAL